MKIKFVRKLDSPHDIVRTILAQELREKTDNEIMEALSDEEEKETDKD